MKDNKSSVDMFLGGNACSQAIFAKYSPRYGLDSEVAMKIASGFSSGMRMAQTCGAVTGSIMILGMHACCNDCDNPAGRKKSFSMVKEFTEKFKKVNKGITCKELLGCDVTTKTGLEFSKINKLRDTICVKAVRSASSILEKMIETK